MIDTFLRDVAALRAAHTAGTGHPLPEETVVAADVARGRWSGPFLRAGLRQCGAELVTGSLAGLLETAATVLEDRALAQHPEATAVLQQLRQLVDALAADCPPLFR